MTPEFAISVTGVRLNQTASLLEWTICHCPQQDREVLSCVLGAVNDALDTLEQLQPTPPMMVSQT